MALKVCGLFSGIGGFELAFSRVGASTNLLCEFDPAGQSVLRAKFPDIELVDDVRKLKMLPRGTDVVCAGFPCQNLSMAGDKSGIRGSKSNVIRSLFELLKKRRAPFVVIENVPFMLHLERGHAMAWLIDELERLGYMWAYRVLDTMAFGLPQRRRRVYLVASTDIDPVSILLSKWIEADSAKVSDVTCPVGFFWTEGRSGVGLTRDGLPPLKAGSAVGIASMPAVLFPDGSVKTPGIETCEALQGFEPGWTEAAVSVNARTRWRLVGNAISVPVATWVATQLNAPAKSPIVEGRVLGQHDAWPPAAFNSGKGRMIAVRPDNAVKAKKPTLKRFIELPWRPLSERALTGFITRAEEGSLHFPKGFIPALKRARKDLRRQAKATMS
jgi:DNA (cytosine-5)-methyltransferase 1